MTPPRFGYLCLFENPTNEQGRALIRQFVLVREADRMGYDDIWIAEQHFDTTWPTGGILALLGYLAGVTSHAKIGPAALLPAFHHPLQVAEEIASLDLLSKGRFQMAVGAGGPFAATNQHFGVPREEVTPRMLEALDLIHQLLKEESVSFAGQYTQTNALSLVPRATQPTIPTWMATTTESTIQTAAKQGYGLMAAATYTHERVKKLVASYQAAMPGADPKLVLARFCFTAKTHDEAMAIAEPYFVDFSARMRALGVEDEPGMSVALNPEALLKQSLIGSHNEVTEQIIKLQEELGPYSLALIPTTAQFDNVKHCLADMVDEVRPQLMD